MSGSRKKPGGDFDDASSPACETAAPSGLRKVRDDAPLTSHAIPDFEVVPYDLFA